MDVLNFRGLLVNSVLHRKGANLGAEEENNETKSRDNSHNNSTDIKCLLITQVSNEFSDAKRNPERDQATAGTDEHQNGACSLSITIKRIRVSNEDDADEAEVNPIKADCDSPWRPVIGVGTGMAKDDT